MRLAERVALIGHDAVVGGTVEALQVQLRVVLHRDDEGVPEAALQRLQGRPRKALEETDTGRARLRGLVRDRSSVLFGRDGVPSGPPRHTENTRGKT